MALLLVQHALQGFSGLPEDRFVNTFHLQGTGPATQPQLDSIVQALQTFYSATGGGLRLGTYMGHSGGAAGRTIKIYDHQAVKPRAPIFEFTDTVVPYPNSAGRGLPQEVASCISFSAPKLSGAVQARRRGRIYIGPLNDAALQEEATTFNPKPSLAFMDACMASFRTLLVDFSAAGHLLMVYSPTTDPGDTGEVGAFSVVTQFWVDDAFDTQRRRGCAPKTRILEQLAV